MARPVSFRSRCAGSRRSWARIRTTRGRSSSAARASWPLSSGASWARTRLRAPCGRTTRPRARRPRLRARPRADRGGRAGVEASAEGAGADRRGRRRPGTGRSLAPVRACERTSSGSVPGEGFPIEEIAAKRSRTRLEENAASLASRLPVLRGPVSEEIVRSFSRKNAIVAAVVFIPGADLPGADREPDPDARAPRPRPRPRHRPRSAARGGRHRRRRARLAHRRPSAPRLRSGRRVGP